MPKFADVPSATPVGLTVAKGAAAAVSPAGGPATKLIPAANKTLAADETQPQALAAAREEEEAEEQEKKARMARLAKTLQSDRVVESIALLKRSLKIRNG